MHAFVISESTDWRHSLTRALRRAGHAAAGSSDADHATAGIRRASTVPDLAIVDAGGDATPLRRLIERVRGAVEDERLPVVTVLPEHSSWHRQSPPSDLQPLIVVPTTASVSDVVHAAMTHAGDGARSELALTFDGARREATGPLGSTSVTPFEARILAAMIRDRPRVTTHDVIAQALWGEAFADRHGRAAIRSHVHSLRRKLSAIGLDRAIDSLPGAGYRLIVDRVE